MSTLGLACYCSPARQRPVTIDREIAFFVSSVEASLLRHLFGLCIRSDYGADETTRHFGAENGPIIVFL
jgi:hypothetical protein